jgi:broad specificity phosphatase PhoE
MKPIQLYLIRHGQSEGNVNTQVYYDKNDCDIQLTDLGHSQSLAAGAELAHMIDHGTPRIICSAYTRSLHPQTRIIAYFTIVGYIALRIIESL